MGKRYVTHADRNPWRQSQPRCSNVQDTGRKFNLMSTPYPSSRKPWGNHSPDFKGVYHTYFQSIWKTILSTNRPRRVTRLRGLPGTPTTHIHTQRGSESYQHSKGLGWVSASAAWLLPRGVDPLISQIVLPSWVKVPLILSSEHPLFFIHRNHPV